jgi:two-component system alkaline phosphatase synthesis response regulator PhoP
MRVLLVEDEENLNKIIKLNLELEGYEVVSVMDGKKALKTIETQYFDLLVLDVMLPEIDGFQICQKVRLQNNDIGIIIISAKDTSQDRITGLKLGADDYLSKPFDLEELLLRVKKLTIRKQDTLKATTSEYSFGKNSINFETYQATGVAGNFILTKKEVLLLKLFSERPNQVVSRNQILQTVWGYDVYPSTRTIDNFILQFRKYFEEDPKNPVYFHSIRSVGYKFTPELSYQ